MSPERASQDCHVELRDIHFRRGSRSVFDGLSCGFPRARISVVIGASGSGKTTLLRLIAGLSRPLRGEIWIDGGMELAGMPARRLLGMRRRFGMMFQRGALLDSMTVYENLALPQREHTSRSEDEIRSEVERLLVSVDLPGVEDLLPGQLSGGMIKRVALARALVLKPEILLCDEPFSGLDPQTLRHVEALLVGVSQRLGVTMIIASHDIESTLRMAHQVVLLIEGGAVCGSPEELRASPDARVRAFFHHDGGHPPAAGGPSASGSLVRSPLGEAPQ